MGHVLALSRVTRSHGPFVLSALRSKVYRRMGEARWFVNSKPTSTPSGVARQLVTFLVLPRKVTKRGRPRFAAPAGFPRYFANKRGCATHPGGAHTPCPTAELGQCSPESPLVGEISRRHSGDEKRQKSKLNGGQQVAHHSQNKSTPVH